MPALLLTGGGDTFVCSGPVTQLDAITPTFHYSTLRILRLFFFFFAFYALLVMAEKETARLCGLILREHFGDIPAVSLLSMLATIGFSTMLIACWR